jgi:S-adenosylmethionine hydrolase
MLDTMAIVTLTTDFGTADWFVGSMKGVILGVEPRIVVVDITHEIPAGDIRAGAFALAVSFRCFPRNTVHCAVVDPGVGTSRAAIAIKTSDYFFVGPDNGVLSFALAQESVLEIWRVENDAYFHKPVSNTFHGRDIFAPVAARLTQHILMDSLGAKLKDYVRLDWPQPQFAANVVTGQIIYIDRFGNALTNIDFPALARLGKRAWNTAVQGRDIGEVRRFYQEVRPSQPLALLGSSGYLEIAVNGGSAARTLGLKIGDAVEVR